MYFSVDKTTTAFRGGTFCGSCGFHQTMKITTHAWGLHRRMPEVILFLRQQLENDLNWHSMRGLQKAQASFKGPMRR